MADDAALLVAGQVRAEMARRRISQEKVAVCLQLSQAAVSRRLTGGLPFDINELAAVAELLDVSLSSLTRVADKAVA